MTAFIIILCVCAVFALAYFCNLFWYDRELEKKSELLDKREVAIEERLAELEKGKAEYNAILREIHGVEWFEASYTVTESDLMRYTTDRAIENKARNSIALTIANDLIRKFEPVVDDVDGKKRFTIKVKVKGAKVE